MRGASRFPDPDLLLLCHLVRLCAAGAGFCGATLALAALGRREQGSRLWAALTLNAAPVLVWYFSSVLSGRA